MLNRLIRHGLQLGRLVIALVLVATLPACDMEYALHEDIRDATLEHTPGAPVRLETVNGHIAVRRAARTDVGVSVTLKCRTPERLEATKVVIHRDDDGALVADILWADGKRLSGEVCSFDIQIPDAVGVELDTDNGSLTTSGLAGDADLSASNGTLSISDHDGDVAASTTNGSISLDGVAGAIRTSTVNGAVTITGAADAVDAETVNGSVKVTLASNCAGSVNLETVNGRITFLYGPAFEGAVECRVGNGSVSIVHPDGETTSARRGQTHTVYFGDSKEPTSRLSTSNGSIRIEPAAGKQV